ncbi:MAG: hypothetical protein ACK41C_18560 [Phenylobacterium sp.]|uniref:hypothetical protein n=1 Tax=Phenylobacterium sp. TaxID=1871053 RepID=UPI00391CE2A7
MIRMIVLSAAAAIAFAAPAHAQSARVALTGKSDAQIEADVSRAVRNVCFKATRNETLSLDAYRRCVKQTAQVTTVKLAEIKAQNGTAFAAN